MRFLLDDFRRFRSGTPVLVHFIGVAWLFVAVSASVMIAIYSKTPGLAGIPPANWPSSSRLILDKNLPTLVMFIHPRCPCTTASLGELELLLTQCSGRVHPQIEIISPAGVETDWTQTPLTSRAMNMPGVTVCLDADGAESQRFRSETSGTVVLYAPDGSLLFHGGITASRGHSGDNTGRDTLTALLLKEPLELKHARASSTPVFGCPLFGNETCQNTNLRTTR